MPEKPTIITNHHYRLMLFGYELTEKEKEEFNYIKPEDFDSHDFFRYRGQIYDLSEAEHTTVKGWDGQYVDSFFSAVLIKLHPEEGDKLMVGTYLA